MGYNQGGVKLNDTEDDVIEIRKLYSLGYLQGYLAGRFGISQCHISEIVNYINWRHVK
jgi:hypothetical protein